MQDKLFYLGFDIETGGFNSETDTILEAYFAIYDQNFNLIDGLELLMVNENGEAVATEEALSVTGINLKEHLVNPNIVKYSEGKRRLIEMLNKHKIPGKKRSYRALGQNIIGFDIPFLWRQGFMGEQEWKKYIHHNSMDTTAIATFLKELEIIPDTVGSLSSLAAYFGITNLGAHRAKNDVQMQVQVYQKMVQALKKSQMDNIGGDVSASSDLFKIVEM